MTILNRFFASLNGEINYCHWKSIDRLDEVFDGKTDVDILIYRNQMTQFHKILADFGAINIKPRLWMTYPSMDDFLLYDPKDGCFYHLHVHYRLIMGKKNAKEYILPLEDLYLNTKVFNKSYNTFTVKPELDLIMLVLRYSVKYSFLAMSYHKLRGIIVSEVNEMKHLLAIIDHSELLRYVSMVEIELNHRNGELYDFFKKEKYKSVQQNISDLKGIKSLISIYRRSSSFEVFFARRLRKYLNIAAAFGRNNAKHAIGGGITIAMVGCDGSGKTTITDAIILEIRSKLSARKYYMGFNARSFSYRTKLLAVLSYLPRSAKFIFRNDFGKKINVFGQLIIEYGGYLDRKKLYQQSLKDKANGMIGFYERFPLKDTIDYPQCFFNERDFEIISKSRFLMKLKNSLEKKYELFRPADLNFFINTPTDIIRERREMSDQTFEKVNDKYQRVKCYVNDHQYYMNIDGSQSLEKVILNVKNHIFNRLC